MVDEQTQTTSGTTQSSQGDQGQSASSTATGGSASTQGSTASQTTSTQTGQTQQQEAPKRPDWLPEKYFDPAKGPNLDEFGKHYSEIATRVAADDVRRLSLPQKPEDVKIELPKDFQLPQGVELKIDPAKPEFAKLQAAAIKHGLTQDAVTDLMGVYAETIVGSQATTNAAKAAEVAKLGANGTARVTALETFFNGVVGEAEGKQIAAMLVTAGIVQSMEKLVSKFASQGTAPFSQSHREPGASQGKVTEEQYAKMSDAERLNYARKFPQQSAA